MKQVLFLLLLIPLFTFGTKVTIVTTSNDGIVQYSIAELKNWDTPLR